MIPLNNGSMQDMKLQARCQYNKGVEKAKKDFSATIIIGTWCKDTKEQMPRFYKIADEMGLNEKKYTPDSCKSFEICR